MTLNLHLRYFWCIPIMLSLVMVSCQPDEESAVIINQMELTQNGETIELINEQVYGNENCGKIFVNASVLSEGDPHFRISFELTQAGRISDILFADYSDNNRNFHSAKYIPSEVFFITNFHITETSLRFDFSGILFERTYQNSQRNIEGSVDIKDLKFVQCSFEPWIVEAEINNVPFHNVQASGRSSEDVTQWQWRSYSDDGYKITIITDDKLEEMPVGRYVFNPDDMVNRVTIEKYNGPYSAFGLTEPGDWEQYEYEGELVITEQGTQTTGTFMLKALKDNEVVYEITNGRFSI